jgi:hypothetical protein
VTRLRGGNAHGVAKSQRADAAAQFAPAVHLVTREPAGPNPGRERVGDHGQRLLRLRRAGLKRPAEVFTRWVAGTAIP